MRNCKCGNQVADNAKACPKCGHRFTGAFTKLVAWVCAAFLGLMVLAKCSHEWRFNSRCAAVRIDDIADLGE